MIKKISLLILLLCLFLPGIPVSAQTDPFPPVSSYQPSAAYTGGRYNIYRPFRGNYSITQVPHAGHWAVDWGMPNNTFLYSPFPSGVVSFAGYTNDGYAYNIRIVDHSQQLMVVMAHLRASKPFAVKVGQAVAWNTVVAYSDNTGNSTGPHLHFEVRVPPYQYANPLQSVLSELDPLPTQPPPNPTPRPTVTPVPPPPPGGTYRARVIQSCKVYSQPVKAKRYQIGKVAPPKIIVVSNYNASWVRYQNGYLRRVCMVRL